MASFLNLLQQSMGLNPLAEENFGDIVVTAPQPRPEASRPDFADAPARDQIQPRYVLNDDRIAPRQEELNEILPRKGMFGLKGTLRDVLGTLGDSLLVGSDADRIYQPQRQRERAGDAMFGFADNPMQAIERLAAAGFLQEAGELYNQVQQQQHRTASLSSQEADRQSRIADRDFDNREKGWNIVARLAQAGMPYDRLVRAAAGYGISVDDLSELGVTPEMTAEDRQLFSARDMTVNQQVQVPLAERRVSTGEFNAETGRINANRPRASRAAPNPTNASINAQSLLKLQRGETLTAGEQEALERSGYDLPTTRRGTTRRQVSPAPSTSSRFR